MDILLLSVGILSLTVFFLMYSFKKSDCKSFFKNPPEYMEVTSFSIKNSFSVTKNKYYIERFRNPSS